MVLWGPLFLFYSFWFLPSLGGEGSSGLRGLVVTEEESSLNPLSIVLADISEWEMAEGGDKAMDGGGRDVAKKAVDAGLNQKARDFGDQ